MDALFERYYKPLVVFADSFTHDLGEAERLDDLAVQAIRQAMAALPEKTRLVVECVMLRIPEC